MATRTSLYSSWAEIEGVRRVRVGTDGLGSRSRLSLSFFAGAIRSLFVSGPLDCLRIFCYIGLSTPTKKRMTSILALSLLLSQICILRVLNRRWKVSSDSLNTNLPYTNKAIRYWLDGRDLSKVDPENLWGQPSLRRHSFLSGSDFRNQIPQ